jgi:hypothetical protein
VEPPSREARRLAAVILDVLAGSRTPQQAAEALSLSLPRYYQLEARAIGGLVDTCEIGPRGRQPEVQTELKRANKEVDRLKRELSRQQTLVRLTQRTVGVAPPPAPAKAGKSGKRKRKPAVRALRRVAELQADTPDLAVKEVEVGVE